MIFLVKGHLPSGRSHFAQCLAEALNPAPPRWPVDETSIRAWEELLRGWEEADTGVFRVHDINVDHAVALVVFEHRLDYPPPPAWSEATPRQAFERWRDACCLDVLNKRLPRVFKIICDLVESVEHPVVNGSELGTTPQDSLLTRMILFKYSRTPHLKILLREHAYDEDAAPNATPTASVFDRRFPPERVLEMIRRSPDGTVSLDPDLRPSWQAQTL